MSQDVTKSLESAKTLFTESTWATISADVAAAMRMSDAERECFQNKAVAKLIAAIPFLAECEDAERTAVAHLGTYLLSVRETKKYFNAKPEDSESITERLRLGTNFKGGRDEIIERGMRLLALVMVTDYRRDAEEDVFLRKYNPVSAGDFDYDTTVRELEKRIKEVSCPEMDAVLSFQAIPEDLWSCC